MTNITRECALADLRPELAELVKGHLTSDDEILYCSEHDRRYAHVITQQRLVIASFDGGILGLSKKFSVDSIFLVDIVSMYEDQDTSYRLNVSCDGRGPLGTSCRFQSREESLKLMSVLQKAIGQAKKAKQAQPIVQDIADQFAKLANLYQDRAITKEEYDTAKRKLLG